MTKVLLATTSLLWRVVAFTGCVLGISGILGPRIVNSAILFNDGFALYGGFGKALIFGLIAFGLLAHKKAKAIKLQRWHAQQYWLIAFSCIMTLATWVQVELLIHGEQSLLRIIATHISLFTSVVLAFIGCFGWRNITILWHKLHKQIYISAIIAALFYVFLAILYAVWHIFAHAELSSIEALLKIAKVPTTVVPPNTLMLDKFSITIAKYCSGIESIALFVGLYAIVGILDWHRLRRKRFFALFVVGTILISLLNLVRMVFLIAAGYYINPAIAFGLFHTYAGLVFFMIFATLFWRFTYKHVIFTASEESANEETSP